MGKIIYNFEQLDEMYGKLVDTSDFKKDMQILLSYSIRENEHRIDELMMLQKGFSSSGKTNTHISYRINKLRWANEKNTKLFFDSKNPNPNPPCPTSSTPPNQNQSSAKQ